MISGIIHREGFKDAISSSPVAKFASNPRPTLRDLTLLKMKDGDQQTTCGTIHRVCSGRMIGWRVI
jgi:hypothetical protein